MRNNKHVTENLKRIYKEYEKNKKGDKLPDHALYSPSKAYLWLNCPAAMDIIRKLPKENDSEASIEGTKKHKLLEKFLNKVSGISWFISPDFPKVSKRTGYKKKKEKTYKDFLLASKFERGEMSLNLFNSLKDISDKVFSEIRPYVDKRSGSGGAKSPACPQFYEERIFINSVLKNCYGTSDFVILSPRTLYIIDWKFGFVSIDPASYQLSLYAIGAYNNIVKKWTSLIPDLNRVCNIIVQPVRNKKPKFYYYSISDLKKREKDFQKRAAKNMNKTRRPVIGPWCENYARCQPHCTKYKENQLKLTRAAFNI